MVSRIPDSQLSQRSLADLAAIKEQMDLRRAQLSSGRKLLRPSDDPAGASRAMQFQAQLDRSERYVANAQSAIDEMNVTDGYLQNASSTLRAARDLVISAGNGSLSPTARAGIAQELRGMRQELLAIANASYRGVAVFSGTENPAATYDVNYDYQGNSGIRERSIEEGVQLTVNLSGDTVFGTGAGSVFATLDGIINRVETGDTSQVATDLSSLDGHLDTVLSGLVIVGSRTNQAQTALDRISSRKIDVARALSDTVDTDIAEATTDLQLQQVAYQSTLQTLATLIRPSLLDFLR